MLQRMQVWKSTCHELFFSFCVLLSLLKVQKLLLGFLSVLDNTEGGVRPRGAVFIFIIYSPTAVPQVHSNAESKG